MNILLGKDVILCAHASLSLRNIVKSNTSKPSILYNSSSTAFIHSSTCCCSSFIGSWLFFVEIIEIIEHKIHIFLFFTLKMMYNSMVFVNFYSYMSVCLSRYCSRFYKLTLLVVVQIVISLRSRNIH